jgi:23S rRNA (cytosine1962-C5)-methyltransferase
MLRTAFASRAALLTPDNNCVRLVCEEEPPRGIAVDLFGAVAVVQARAEVETAAVVQALIASPGVDSVYVRSVGVSGAEVAPEPVAGVAAPQLEVLENGVRFLIEPASTSVGLFLDARDNRRRVRERARGRRVLNTFAHTCGFSVCAALGGASEVVSVDAARRYLEWGKANWALNPVGPDVPHITLCDDVIAAVERAARNGRAYDMIILDPPTFGRSKRGRWQIQKDLARLFAGAVSVAAPDALVFLCTNHRGTTLAQLEAGFASAVGARAFEVVERPPLPLDFAASAGYAKSVWIRLGS